MGPTSQIEIDLSALERNLATWQERLGPACELCAVVKADGYGMGAVPIAQRLVARGVKMLAVYTLMQATELAKAGVQAEMLVLMPVDEISRTDILYRATVSEKLHLTVHSIDQLRRVQDIGMKFGARMPVHVEIDTGLSRLGMSPDDADDLMEELPKHRYVRLAGLFTHAASPIGNVKLTDKQLALFDDFLERHAERIRPDVRIHFAGTHAALRDKRYHKTMARIGLGLYGYGARQPKSGPWLEPAPQLHPVLRWTSHLANVKTVPRGTGVGYDHQFTTKRKTRLGIVPVGYGDGYPLALSGKGVVCVGPEAEPAPVLGQVSMDQLIVDLSGVDESVGEGAEVELIGRDPDAPNDLETLAELAGTIPYDMTCRLSSRIQRRYIVVQASGQVGHVVTV